MPTNHGSESVATLGDPQEEEAENDSTTIVYVRDAYVASEDNGDIDQ